MKKVKIMLFSLALLAVVGGAVAFKVKGTTNYCTVAFDEELGACPQYCTNLLENASTKINAPFVCTALATTTLQGTQEINTCTTFNGPVAITRQCGAITTRATVD